MDEDRMQQMVDNIVDVFDEHDATINEALAVMGFVICNILTTDVAPSARMKCLKTWYEIAKKSLAAGARNRNETAN